MFVASNHDPEGISWTGIGPSKVVAARLTSLAKIARSIMNEQGVFLQAAAIFTPSLLDYDFVLHLMPKHTYTDSAKKTVKKENFKNLQFQYQQHHPVPSTVAIRSFLDELRGFAWR